MKRRWVPMGIALGVAASVLPTAALPASAAPANGGGSASARSRGRRATTAASSTSSGPSAGCSASRSTTPSRDGKKIQLAVSRVKHTVARRPSTRASCWSTRAAPAAPASPCSVARRVVPDGAGERLRLDRLRPARRRLQRAGADVRRRTTATGPPAVRADDPGHRGDLADPVQAATPTPAAAHGGALLDHLKTTRLVNDMESIRKALGEEQINFYGFSYGTYLGQVYATLHPTGCAAWCSTATSTRARSGTRPTSTRTALRAHDQRLLRLGGQARRRLPPRHHRHAVS